MDPSPVNPGDWPNAYSRDQAYRDKGKMNQVTSMAILVGIILFDGYIAIRLVPRLGFGINATSPLQFIVVLLILILVTVLVTLFVFLLFVVIHTGAASFASRLMAEFYQLPSDFPIMKMITYRLFGKMKLPPPLSILTSFKSITFKDGQIFKGDEWVKWSAENLGGPATLTVFDGCALYLERGNRFSRVVGSGNKPPFLEWFETVKYVVDLRPKIKEDSFEVWTKDGIKVKLTARIVGRIYGPVQQPADTDLLYPFDPIAVKKAVENLTLRRTNPNKEPEECNWFDAAWGQVTSIVPSYIGSRWLDDLLIADRKSGQILAPEVVKKLVEKLKKATGQFGVEILDFQIQQIEIPAKVAEQQKENWKAIRQVLATKNDGKAKAFDIQSREQARAEAQKDLILAIAAGLEINKSRGFSEPLILSLSGILDESLQDPLIRATIAGETLDTLEKVQKMLNPPKKSGDGNASQRTEKIP
jgi:regulator of protease activity HflC (stomatin/prohibitin superfamily)